MAKRSDIINAVAEETGFTKGESNQAVVATLGAISEFLSKHEEVHLPGFGKFVIKTTRARKCRNPQTGETIMVQPKVVTKFKPAKALKDAVNQE